MNFIKKNRIALICIVLLTLGIVFIKRQVASLIMGPMMTAPYDQPIAGGVERVHPNVDQMEAIQDFVSSEPVLATTEKEIISGNEDKKIETLRKQAKNMLAAGYTAQKAFYAEFNRYSTDLKAMGLTPNGDVIDYKMGYLKQFVPADSQQDGTPEDLNSTTNITTDMFIGQKNENSEAGRFEYGSFVKDLNLEDYSRFCKAGCTARLDGFEILLVMPVIDAKHVDVWVINENKEMKLVQDGTK